jgi:hypothetical protein
VGYPALLSAAVVEYSVGFIPALKGEAFSSILRNYDVNRNIIAFLLKWFFPIPENP